MSSTSLPAPSPFPAPRARSAPAPALAAGVELLGEMRGSGYRTPQSLVRRCDGQTIQLTSLLYETLRAIDGRRDLHELAIVIGERVGRRLGAEDVSYLIEHKLRPLGLVRSQDGSEPVTRTTNPLLALRLRFVITDPRVTTAITRPFAALFDPFVVMLVLAGFGAAVWGTLFGGSLGAAIDHAFHDPAAMLAVLGLTIVSVGFHEFGHAAACLHGGAKPGAMGAGLYLVWPAFYTDVTDSYRLGRAGRLRVDLGGLYFNALFSAVAYGVWLATGWDALLLLVVTQLVQMVRQLVPIVRFDGYHILADLTGVPDLFQHVGPTLRRLVPGRGDRVESPLKPWARRVVATWVLLVVPLLLALLAAMVITLPRLAATALDGASTQWSQLLGHLGSQAYAAAGVAAVGVLTLVSPVAGIVYLLARLAYRGGRRVWASAADRPRRRAGVVVAASAVAAALALAWWPQGQYEPVQPDRDATIGDLLASGGRGDGPVGLRDEEAVLLAAADDRHESEEHRTVSRTQARASDRFSSAVPDRTADRSTPVASAAQPADAWPFPWARPAPAAAGDNRAYVVNTQDGAARHDVSIAQTYVVGGADVRHRNEAWALASCTGCRTLAVAFQAVFIVGEATDVVVPANLSRAANVSCDRCVTRAVADQLVLTLDRMPDGVTRGRVTSVIGRLRALEGQAPSMSPERIAGELAAARHEIRTILDDAGYLAGGDEPEQATADGEGGQDPVLQTADSTEPEQETSPSPEASPSPQDEPSPSPTASSEPSPSPTPPSEPSPSPSSEPSPSPSSEPSPSPSPSPSPEGESSPSPEPTDTSSEPEPSPSPTASSSESEPEPSPTATSGGGDDGG